MIKKLALAGALACACTVAAKADTTVIVHRDGPMMDRPMHHRMVRHMMMRRAMHHEMHREMMHRRMRHMMHDGADM